MASDIERLEVLIEANTAAYTKAMVKLQSDTDKALKQVTRSVSGFDAQLRTLQSTVTKVAGVFGIAFGGRALIDFVKGSVEAGKAIAEQAIQMGVAATTAQELSYAAEQAGASQESLGTAFKAQSKIVAELERGTKAAKDQFAELGLTINDIKGKSPEQVFELLLTKIGQLQDPIARSAELVKFFGKSGEDMAPLALAGAAGIDAMRQRFRDLGLELTNEEVAQLKDAGDKMADIGAAGKTAGERMAIAFIPAIEALDKLITDPAFQKGLVDTATNLANIVGFIAANPDLLRVLAGAAAGFAVGGIPGALAGGAAGEGMNLGDKLKAALAPKQQVNEGGKGDFAGTTGVPSFATDAEIAAAKAKLATGLAALHPPPGPRDASGDAEQKKYEDLAAAIKLATDNLSKSVEEQYIANEVAKLGAEATTTQKDAIAALAKQEYEATKAQKALNDATGFFAETAFNAFDGLISGGTKFTDVLKNMLPAIEKVVLQAALLGQGPLAGLFGTSPTGNSGVGGIFGAIAGAFLHRAGGGNVSGGTPYIVGERGPELMIPKGAGEIVPNSSGRGAPGGRVEVVIHNLQTPFFDQHIDVRATGVAAKVFQAGSEQASRRQDLAA